MVGLHPLHMHASSHLAARNVARRGSRYTLIKMSGSKAAVEALSGGMGSLIAMVATYPLKTAYTLKVMII